MATTKKTNGNDHVPATKAATKTKARTIATRSTASAKGDAALQVSVQREPSREEIAHRAYQLFEQRGCQHGHHADDWFRAESELRMNARRN